MNDVGIVSIKSGSTFPGQSAVLWAQFKASGERAQPVSRAYAKNFPATINKIQSTL
jgi:hypothetical protein